MKWFFTKDKLPKEGKYVLAIHTRGTWIDKVDPYNVNCVVVRLVKGISQKERRQMKKKELLDSEVKGWCKSAGWTTSKRSKTIKAEDEEGNNLVPYCWDSFGVDSFFGQNILCWTYFKIPEKAKNILKRMYDNENHTSYYNKLNKALRNSIQNELYTTNELYTIEDIGILG